MTAPVGSLAAYLSVRGAAQARQDILSVQRQLGLAGESATTAGVALDRSEAAITGAGRAAAGTATRANQLRAAQLGVVAATERYNRVLADEGATVGRLATSEASLIRAKEREASITRTAAAEQAKAADVTRSAALANSEMVGSSSRASQAMGGTVKQLGLMFGGFELLKKAIDYGKEASKFQQEMLQIQTMAGASAKEVGQLSDAVLKLAPQVATGPVELAQALYHIEQNSHGLITTAQAMEALRVGAEGAKIGMADVEETTNTLTIALTSGIKGMGSMQQAMGTMLAIAGTGDMRLKHLNEALSGGILAVAKGFGASLYDVAAVLATLGDNGTRGADAATALRQTLMGFAQPAKGGAAALASVGLAMHDLRDEVQKHGLVAAMNDLDRHMTAAGVTGSKVGGFITEAFGRKAGAGISVLMEEIDRVNHKFADGMKGGASFGDKWTETTKTAAFAWKQFGIEIQTNAIALETKALPAVTGLAHILAAGLPVALGIVHDALAPVVSGFHMLGDVLPPVGHAIAEVGSFLGPLEPVFKFLAVDVVATWAAFKGYQVARFAIQAVADGINTLKTRAVTGLTSLRAYGTGVNATLAGNATEAQLTSAIMQAEFDKVAASAAAEAAAIDKAAMNQAIAFADLTAASKAASDAQVLAAEEAASAATAQARASALAAETAAAAAEEAAVAVETSGEAAAIGWTAILGPIGAVAIGVGLLVSMFHKSAQSSKEATDATKAYGQALLGVGKNDLFSTIAKQLTDNNIPEKIDALNRSLGAIRFTSVQFAEAIEKGGPALDALKKRLGALVDTGTAKQQIAALQLLGDVSAQTDALTKAVKKDLADTKAFAGVSSSIDKISESTKVGTETAKKYAAMSGILVDKNGVAAVSAGTLEAAVKNVSKAYNTATSSGNDFLTALSSFSQSAGTAADRAALIGATLKAANGDALGFAGAMASTTSAVNGLVDAFKQQHEQLAQQFAQQSADAQKSAAGVTKANRAVETSNARLAAARAKLNQVRDNPLSTPAKIAAAQAAVTAAQNGAANSADRLRAAQTSAGKAGTLAYSDTERAAIHFKKTTDGLSASIDTNAKGAGDLVSQLQSMQTAALGAAGAMFQHEVATKGAKVAADDAYNIYVSKTSRALVDERKGLGLTKKEADALAGAYFGMPKNIKTQIEAEGTNPILTVLNKIGALLAHITGQQWDVFVNIKTRESIVKATAGMKGTKGTDPRLGGYASGTDSATAGWKWVGEHGPELMRFRGGEQVLNNKTSMQMPNSKTVHIDKLEVNQHYPRPDTGTIALPHAMRAAEHALGGL